ncbi:hypothetical protein [Streptomyces sp. NPDC093094]|uniref:hypothetical protein n=1 Tax=Streptomyces sp. NPDC093094 TaxID=3366026 RepID=UPI00382E9187
MLAAGSVFCGLVVLLDVREIDSTAELDAGTLLDLVKLFFGVVAGAGALVALVVAHHRQRVDEAGAHLEATRLHTERFSQAVDELGSDSPAVRLGGVHALAGLADDAPDGSLRQTCIDVLCACLQLPFLPAPASDPATRRHATTTWPSVRSGTPLTWRPSAAQGSPAPQCSSTTRVVQRPWSFSLLSALLLLQRSPCPGRSCS